MNEKRKVLQKEIADSINVNDENKVIIATIEEKVAGIAGILANTISEKYMKPCFVLHDSGDILGGSARTYGKFPVIECLNNSRDLIINGGGHAAMAGGFVPFSGNAKDVTILITQIQERFLQVIEEEKKSDC